MKYIGNIIHIGNSWYVVVYEEIYIYIRRVTMTRKDEDDENSEYDIIIE